MITNSPFVQLFMVVLAGGILLLYIKPTIEDIRTTQDQIGIYEHELERVNEVNGMLSTHIGTINALPLSDVQALERYIPTVVDEIAVMRDLQLLVNEVGVKLVALEFGGENSESSSESEATNDVTSVGTPVIFNLGVEATYRGLRQLLQALEVNDYQFTILSAEVLPTKEGLLAVDLDLMTYALGVETVETNVDESASLNLIP